MTDPPEKSADVGKEHHRNFICVTRLNQEGTSADSRIGDGPACVRCNGIRDAKDYAEFMGDVRALLRVLDERLTAGADAAEEVRAVQRDLAALEHPPFRMEGASTERPWKGHAARIVRSWPPSDPVRAAVLDLRRRYLARLP